MKKTTWILSVLMASLLAFSGAGCKKNAASERPQTPEEAVVQLRAALATASPEVRSSFYDRVESGIRYGQPLEAMMALDQIAKDPSLNDQQKKLVNNVIELLKQKVQNSQNASAPAQSN